MTESWELAWSSRFDGTANILLVDDNPANLLALRAILDDPIYDIVEVRSGEEALVRLKIQEFAVVLLDVRMPGLSGFETARIIRADERSRHTPIIFLTADDIDQSKIDEGYALGAVDFFVKPLSPKAVQAKVRGFAHLFQEKQQARHDADQLRLLVQGTKDYAIFLLDSQGHVATWNTGAERIKQYTAEQIIGQHFSNFYPQDAIDRGWPAHELKVAAAEGRFEDEGWRIRKDSSRFWANVVITALRDEQGQLRGFSNVTRDLTERKRAEENDRRLLEETTARRVAEENARLIHGERELLRVTLASIGDAVISTDAEGRVDFLNSVAQELVGWNNEEAAGRPLEDVFHIVNEATRLPVENPALRSLREGRIVGLANHTILISKEGAERPIDDSAAPIRDTSGNVMGSVLVFRDISERKRNEQQVREQQEWLRVTLASIGDAVIATDIQGRVTFLNPVAQELTGWTEEDAQGKPLEVVFRILNEQSRQAVENPVSKVLRDGVIVGLGNHTVLIAKDGSERPIDDSAAPIRDTSGNIMGVVLIFRDVSEQRLSGRELRSSEARKTAILETALDCIITMDHEGKIVEFNPAAERTFGFRRDQVIGRELADFIIPPVLRERHRRGMAHYLATGEGPVLGKRLELPGLRADGTEFPVELAITRISTDGPPLFTAYLRDIAEQKQVEQHRNLRLAVTSALNEASSIDDGANGVLGSVCEHLGWDVGFFWSAMGDHLTCRASWHRPEVTAIDFEKASCSRTFNKGEGLPGRVWASGEPAWILDIIHDPNFPRLASAVDHGLHSAFACPVVVANRTLGVIEFFTKSIREADPGLLETMGTIAGNVGQFIERKVAEDELRRSEQELSDFFENATVGLHLVGPDGIVLRANRAELNMLGYSREEYVGRPIADFHADENVICDILRRLEAGENLIEYPAQLRCKDGSVKDVLIDSSVNFKDGEFVHTRCFTRDVTERRRAEAEAREQERRSRTILESITDAFCAIDREWRFTYVNRQAEVLMGRSREDLLGKNHWEEYPDTLGTELERQYRRVAAEKDTATFEFFFPPHDRWYEIHAYPSQDGLSVYFRDVSQRRHAEAALRESEGKLRLLADTIPQLAWMARPDGHIFWYNRRWYEYTGTTPDEMDGWGWQSVHDPVQLPSVLERWKASIDTGEPFEMVFPLKGADQRFRTFLTRVNPFRDQDGRVVYWFGTNTDIEDQKQAQEALAQSEQRFRQLADAMPQIVWTARPDGDIDYLNSRWTEFTGLPGTTGNQGWRQILHPDEAQPAAERWATSQQSGAPFEMELRLLSRDQTYRWHLIRTVAVHDESGKVVRWFGTGTDIHEQKRAEESSRYLAEASAALAGVVDYESTLQKVATLAVPYFADWSAVDMVNSDGSLRRLAVAHQDTDKIALVQQLMHEYPPDPDSPTGAVAVLRTGKPQIIAEIPDEMLAQAAKDEHHLTLIRSLGLKSYICVPLIASGNPLGVLTFATAESGRTYGDTDLALAMDLAQRAGAAIENTQLYQALRETDRRKDEFLATLAHELRNPLAPIRNSLQILNMPRVDEEMAQRSREMMERQVHHLVRLVDDLLDVSRVMRGKIELRKERIELATVVARAVETVQPLIDAQGHQLSVRLSPESLAIDVDPVRLAQVIGNLLTNAAKYTDANGHIWLTAERDGNEAVLRVRDTGIGIAPPMLPRIFELFVQVDHASTKAQGGLGIGLTLVKNLVEMHSGTVEARSEGLGKGSEFVVRLPIPAQQLPQTRSEPERKAASIVPSGLRLLVVDDNQDAGVSLAMLLKLQGHEVRVAHSGPAAMEMMKGYVPHAVFLDIGMPGMDGYEVARWLRQQPGLENVVLAALTGWGQQEDRRRTSAAGFDYHLVKPPEPKAIEEVLAFLSTRK